MRYRLLAEENLVWCSIYTVSFRSDRYSLYYGGIQNGLTNERTEHIQMKMINKECCNIFVSYSKTSVISTRMLLILKMLHCGGVKECRVDVLWERERERAHIGAL